MLGRMLFQNAAVVCTARERLPGGHTLFENFQKQTDAEL